VAGHNTDRARFESAFREHYDAVLRFAKVRADPDTARDVTAETFTAAWNDLDRLPDEPRPWLLAVARRKLADHYRTRARRARGDAHLAAGDAAVVPDHAAPIAAHDAIRAALARLKRADQEILRLIAWDELTRAEAAQVLGCSTAQVAVRLHRARRRFRAALELEDPAEPVRAQPSTTRPALPAAVREGHL
jgi:RNA polymerase sigma-70 factor (ECF subfamily)